MKKILHLLFIYLFLQSNLKAQQNDGSSQPYYYFGNQKIALQKSSQKIYLRLSASETIQVKALLKNNYQLSDKSITELQDERFMVVDLGLQNSTKLQNLVTSIKNSNRAEAIFPIITASDGKDVVFDEGFYVKLKPTTNYLHLASLAAQNNCIIEKQYPYNNKTYLLKAGFQNNYDGLKMANLFFESGLFEYAEPDFRLLDASASVPNDPLFNYQWAAGNTGSVNQYSGTVGADIDLDEAWDISQGSASIKVAVIDEGIQRTHPDLVNNISPLGFGLVAANATTGEILSTARSHGVSCAGIIAAEANNNIGVAGVAPLCKLIPVNVTINTGGTYGTSTQLAQCIDWSWDQGGADVLSNSWGGGTASSLIHDAIIRATTLGRGGKGAVVVFASANNNAGLSSPAIFKETIAVGAMSMCYQRKSGTSCDGETFWGGNYGTGLDISAPGVKIATTKVTGTGIAPNLDYNLTFNGTSSATPFVSGVAALVLSINPNFTQQQVREIIEKSAKKVGPYSYSFVQNQPNGSWTSELGHGMVNAKNALLLAQNPVLCHVELSSPASLQVCSGGSVPLSITNHVAGNTYEWRKDGVNAGSGNNFNANQTGDYDVILTTASGCKDTSYKLPILVSASEGALVADAGRDTTLYLNEKTILGGGPAGSGGTGIIHPMRAFGADLSNNQLVRFSLQQPNISFKYVKNNFITAPVSGEFYAGAATTPYGIYMINRLSNMLVKVDTATGNTYSIGNTGIAAANGATYDPVSKKLFAIRNSGTSNILFEVNRLTGVATQIAPITGIPSTDFIISISVDNNGQLYGLVLSATLNVSAKMISINKVTGAASLVGGTGFLANFAQGGEVDPITDEIYQMSSTSVLGSNSSFSGKGLWRINKTSGLATLVGSIAEPYNTFDAMAIAGKEYKYQWSPATFLSNANDANPQFTGTTPGVYTYTLTVTDLCGNTNSNQVTITVESTVLPVTLVSLSGQLQQNKTLLHWTAQNEINFSRYEVERSTDATQFSSIGQVNAQGSISTVNYNFTDNVLPKTSIIYYRLKMIDQDGSFRYSNSIALRQYTITKSKIVSLSPNPFVQTLTIQYDAVAKEKINGGIYNSRGQLIKQLHFNANEGSNQFYINGEGLLAGIYVLRLQTGKEIFTQKIVKQ